MFFRCRTVERILFVYHWFLSLSLLLRQYNEAFKRLFVINVFLGIMIYYWIIIGRVGLGFVYYRQGRVRLIIGFIRLLQWHGLSWDISELLFCSFKVFVLTVLKFNISIILTDTLKYSPYSYFIHHIIKLRMFNFLKILKLLCFSWKWATIFLSWHLNNLHYWNCFNRHLVNSSKIK